MKKLLNGVFVPEPGEIMQFAEVYGKPAGSGMSDWRKFGTSNNKENPVAICIRMEPFTTTETEFVVSANQAMTNNIGNRVLIVSPKPYAEPGDPDNVAEMEYGYGKLNSGLRFFVNDKDEPPQGKSYTTKWVYNPETGSREQVQVEVDAGKWLRPGVEYFITYARIGAEYGSAYNNPLSLYVVGSDHPDQVTLDVSDMVGELPAEEIAIGERTGLVVWDV